MPHSEDTDLLRDIIRRSHKIVYIFKYYIKIIAVTNVFLSTKSFHPNHFKFKTEDVKTYFYKLISKLLLFFRNVKYYV